MLFVVRIGIDHKDRLLLFDACEVKKIRVDDGCLRAVSIGGSDVVSIEDRQRIGGKLGG